MILTTGCSFTYGDELLDRENEAWPFVLGKLTDYEVDNFGVPAADNEFIMYMTMKQILENPYKHDYAVIQWTTYIRGQENVSDETAFTKWVYQVIGLQAFLDRYGVEYLMFNGFDNEDHIEEYAFDVYSNIDTSRFIGWPSESMVTWAYGTDNMPKGHPGPEGHKRVAEQLWQYLG